MAVEITKSQLEMLAIAVFSERNRIEAKLGTDRAIVDSEWLELDEIRGILHSAIEEGGKRYEIRKK